MVNTARNMASLLTQIANLEKELQALTLNTYKSALEILHVSEIDFVVEPTEQWGVSFNRVIMISVGGLGNSNLIEKMVRGNDQVIDTVRDIFYQEYRNGDEQAYQLIAKDTLLQHILHHKIDFDTAIDALTSISYLDGRVLQQCIYGLERKV